MRGVRAQINHRIFFSKKVAYLVVNLDHQQRMAPQFKEIIAHSNLVQSEHVSPNLSDLFLQIGFYFGDLRRGFGYRFTTRFKALGGTCVVKELPFCILPI